MTLSPISAAARRHPQLTAGLIVVFVVLAFGPVGTLFVDTDLARVGSAEPNLSPSLEHLLGTDAAGRDLLAVMVAGTPLTLRVGFPRWCCGTWHWHHPRLSRWVLRRLGGHPDSGSRRRAADRARPAVPRGAGHLVAHGCHRRYDGLWWWPRWRGCCRRARSARRCCRCASAPTCRWPGSPA